jgi:ribonuclease HII
MSKAKQILIIDESGDAGISNKEGVSKYITFGVVFFENLISAQECDSKLEILKNQMGIDTEFKFSKLSTNKRLRFLKEIVNSEFYFFYVTIDKQSIVKSGNFDEASFYKYACSLGFLLAKPYLENAVVIVDGSGSKEFQNVFKKYINNQLDGKISKFKIQDSKKNNLIQLADMVAGSVAKRTSIKAERDQYYNIIKHRCIDHKYYPDNLLGELQK